jgi:hypothetical protein
MTVIERTAYQRLKANVTPIELAALFTPGFRSVTPRVRRIGDRSIVRLSLVTTMTTPVALVRSSGRTTASPPGRRARPGHVIQVT